MQISPKALVLFSGGQDSTTCLAWALSRFESVETLGFDYGQRHRAELEARPRILAFLRERFPDWRARLGPDHVLPLNMLSEIGGSALTEEAAIRLRSDGLPTTFVPGRNLLFLVGAAALASRRGADSIVGGMCETDYSGYPDCRHETIEATARAIALGFAEEFVIHTPLMFIDKAQTWRLAEDLGGSALVDLIVSETVTCYLGDDSRHAWGQGCGTCPSCDLRRSGWERWRES
jgi:7-cyano-7-deazaguanine synthase